MQSEGADQRTTLVHGGAVEMGQRWRYKPNRGSGAFTVVRVTGVKGPRITLRAWNGRDKTISLRTLRGDYERADS